MEKIYRYITLRLAVAAMIMAAVSSCREADEPTAGDGAKISYSVDVKSKAGTLYTESDQITGFKVYALTADGKPYIAGDLITRQEDNNFAGKYDRYWPEPGEKLGFVAFSGLDKEEAIDFVGDGTSVTLQNYHIVKDIEEKKNDVENEAMYLNPDREFDLLVAATGELAAPGKVGASAAVGLQFMHALSCIEFRVRNIDRAIDVEITGIGLKHVQNWGHLKTYLVGEKSGRIEWDLSVLSNDTIDDRKRPTFKIPFDAPVELHGEIESEAKTLPLPGDDAVKDDPSRYTLMMIPQKLNAFYPKEDGKAPFRPHGASLMLRANIWNVADDDGEHDDTDKKVWGLNEKVKGEGEWMLIPCGDTWEPGKRYIYTITFGGDGSYGGYEEDEVKDDKDRVFDPIGFTVEIETWIPGGDIVKNIY